MIPHHINLYIDFEPINRKSQKEKTMIPKERMNPNKTTRSAETSPLIYARVYFLLYLVHFGSFFNLGIVHQSLIVPGDAATTVNNIMASESLFRIGFVSDLIGQAVFILLALVLYKLLKPVNKNQAALMVILALVGIPIAMLNLLNQFAALLLLSGAEYLTVFEPDHLHARVMLFLDLQRHGVFIAQIFWSFWLFPLAYLVFKSGFLPRILGILLLIAGFGYLIDFVIFFLFPSFDVVISGFTWWGELILALWLLIKGVNVEKWEKLALDSA
jgi:hypothetical protein